MSIYDRLKELQITLPAPSAPVAAFVPYVRTGNLLFLSGTIARKEGKSWKGKVSSEVPLTEAIEAARGIAIEILGTLHAATGDLAKIKRIVKLMVLVNSDPSFTEQHLVANGASDLFVEIFGDVGAHARSAFGVAQIPMGSCVEIEVIAELE